MAILTEADIDQRLTDRKPISSSGLLLLRSPHVSDKFRNDLVSSIALTGESGKSYIAMSRRDHTDAMNFSVILALVKSGGGRVNLIRCNGHHGPHLNPLERITIPANTCHVHRITERYQTFKNSAPERFAEATDGYHSFEGAVDFFAERFGLYISDPDGQASLLKGYKSLYPLFRDLDKADENDCTTI